MLVKCGKYKSLVIHDLGVKFKNGEAVVTNTKALEKMRAMSKSFGFTFEEEPDSGNSSDTQALAEAKAKADAMGIVYSGNIGLSKLLERIAEAEKAKQ